MRQGSLSHWTNEKTKAQRGEATRPKFTKPGRVRTETWSNFNDPRIVNKFLNIFGQSGRHYAHFARLGCSGTIILPPTPNPEAMLSSPLYVAT